MNGHRRMDAFATRARRRLAWLAANGQALREVAIVALVSLLIASLFPAQLGLVAFANMLGLTAAGYAVIAGIVKEPLDAPRINSWHQAILMFVLGAVAALFIDPAALR